MKNFVVNFVLNFVESLLIAKQRSTTFRTKFTTKLALLPFCVAVLPQSLLACSACFGKSDSNLAKGMNMGIFALLGVVAVVLGGIASFFVYLGRRAGAQAASAQNLSQQPADKTEK